MARFRVPPSALQGESVALRGSELRHLREVLRLRKGERVELFDGEGHAKVAEIVEVGGSSADLRIVADADVRTESPLDLTLAIAVPKAAKLDWVIEKATELGVSTIVPFASERTVRGGREAPARHERWQRIATAAAAQSRRSRAPEIAASMTFDDVAASASRYDLALLFWEAAESPFGNVAAERPTTVLAVTGAEGGFSASEAESAIRNGCRLVGLGPRILRAETAAIAAVTLCQYLWGDLAARPAS